MEKNNSLSNPSPNVANRSNTVRKITLDAEACAHPFGIPDCFERNPFAEELELVKPCDGVLALIAIRCRILPLKKITLDAENCASNIMYFLRKYCSLSSFSIRSCSYDDVCWNSLFLGYLDGLRCLHLHDCPNFTNLSFFYILKNCKKLESLKISRTSLGKNNMPEHAHFFKHQYLEYIWLSSNPHLEDRTLSQISWLCPKLKSLELSANPRISYKSITLPLRSNMKLQEEREKIKVLKLSYYGYAGLFEKYVDIPYLEELYVKKSEIIDEGLVMVGKQCQGLKKLVLEGCNNVTTSAVIDAFENSKKLEIIKVNRCSKAAIADIASFSVNSTRPFSVSGNEESWELEASSS